MTTNEPVYRPKRLAWEEICHGVFVAHTIFGSITVAHGGVHPSAVEWSICVNGKCLDNNWNDAEAAIAAVESWHRERMLCGLEEVVR